MATVEQLLSRGTPTATLRVPLDGGAAAAELVAARQRLSAARLAGRDPAEAQEAVDEAEAALADAEVQITLRGLPRPDYRKLEEAHPPTDAQLADAKKAGNQTPPWNEDFPTALVAACMTDPELTMADAIELFTTWAPGDLAQLVSTCQNLCLTSQIGRAGKR